MGFLSIFVFLHQIGIDILAFQKSPSTHGPPDPPAAGHRFPDGEFGRLFAAAEHASSGTPGSSARGAGGGCDGGR